MKPFIKNRNGGQLSIIVLLAIPNRSGWETFMRFYDKKNFYFLILEKLMIIFVLII
jgi:hypothetical protein